MMQEMVDEMWRMVAPEIKRAGPSDTIHFLHEEACEVAKVAMRLGLIGDHSYERSEKVMATVYTLADLVYEVGDVLLMAYTLASVFDLDATVCLMESVQKFHARAEAKRAADQRATEASAGGP